VKKLSIFGLGGKLLHGEQGQALAEYAAMLGVLLGLLFIAKVVGFNAKQLLERVVANLH